MNIRKLLKRILPESITSYITDISVRLFNCEKAIEMLLDEKKMEFNEANAFNGQVKRREIFMEIVNSVLPDCIIETGTWTGETTAFMADVSGKPVLSCETNQILTKPTKICRTYFRTAKLSVATGRRSSRCVISRTC